MTLAPPAKALFFCALVVFILFGLLIDSNVQAASHFDDPELDQLHSNALPLFADDGTSPYMRRIPRSPREEQRNHCELEGCSKVITTTPRRNSIGFYPQSPSGEPSGRKIKVRGKNEWEFPEEFVVRDFRGRIDLKATRNNWVKESSLREKLRWETQENETRPIHDSPSDSWYFPVKILRSQERKAQYGQRGYVSIDEMIDNSAKIDFQHENPSYPQAKPIQETWDSSPVSETHGQGYSETTRTNSTPRIPEPTPVPVGSGLELEDCRATQYKRTTKEAAADARGKGCMSGMTTTEKIEKIFRNVNEINRLRPEFYLDPRFSICIAKKESDFYPNVSNTGSSARGMYQVTNETHIDADKYIGRSRLPGFSHLSVQEYQTQMVRSTLAQTSIHHRVLQHKALTTKYKRQLTSRNHGMEYWNLLAKRYFASMDDARDTAYASKIEGCHRCLNTYYSASGTKLRRGSAKECIEKIRPETP